MVVTKKRTVFQLLWVEMYWNNEMKMKIRPALNIIDWYEAKIIGRTLLEKFLYMSFNEKLINHFHEV